MKNSNPDMNALRTSALESPLEELMRMNRRSLMLMTAATAGLISARAHAITSAEQKCSTELPEWIAKLRRDLEAMASDLQKTLRPWQGPTRVFRPESFGHRSGQTEVSTQPIQAAMDAAAKAGGGTVRLDQGDYVSGTLVLRSKVRLEVAKGARLLASLDLDDYPEHVASRRTVQDTNMGMNQSLIFAEGCVDIAITGEGKIDGRGTKDNFAGKETVGSTPGRPFLIRVLDCKRVHIDRITLINAACWMQNYLNCEEVLIENITVSNQANFNNDGVDIDGCRDVIVRNCVINAEDDALCFKGASQRTTERVLVENCKLFSSCNGIKFGTDSQGDFRNVLVRNLEVGGTPADLPALQRRNADSAISWEVVDGGTVENVYVHDARIVRTESPFFIRLGDRGRVKPEDPKPGPGVIRHIVFERIRGNTEGARGSMILGIPDKSVEGVALIDVQLEAQSIQQGAPSAVSIPEMRADYPDAHMIGKLSPAYGLWARDAKEITLKAVSIRPNGKDVRPQFEYTNVKDVCELR